MTHQLQIPFIKREIKKYEEFLEHNKSYFDALSSSDENFVEYMRTMPDDLVLTLSNSVNKYIFDENTGVQTEFKDFNEKMWAIHLHDMPLIDLRLLHSSIIPKKKNRFIAAGSLHMNTLSRFFSELGFKEIYSSGDVYDVSIQNTPEPVDVNKAMREATAQQKFDQEPSSMLLKFLKLKSDIDQSSFSFLQHQWVLQALQSLPSLVGAFLLSKKVITPALGLQNRISRYLSDLIFTTGLCFTFESILMLNGSRIAHNEHLRKKPFH